MQSVRQEIAMSSLPIKAFYVSSAELGVITTHPHWHSAIELLYIDSGTASQQIEGNIFEVNTGDIIIIGSNQIHSTYSIGSILCNILVVQFVYDEIYNYNSLIGISFTKAIDKQLPIYAALFEIMHNIYNELDNLNIGCGYEIKANVYKFYSLLLRNAENLPTINSKCIKNKEILIKIFDYIDKYYDDNITLFDASNYVHLSIPHFLRIFKAGIGQTFKQYLNMYRINKSVQYLVLNNSVNLTSSLVGFNDVNTFIRLFKKFKKITPFQYKKM